jgi:hypothetical protein
MIEGFLLDGIDAESARAAPGGQDDRIVFSSTHEAEATLTFMKTAQAGTDIASDAAIVEESPVVGGMGGHTGRLTQGKWCGPEIPNRT